MAVNLNASYTAPTRTALNINLQSTQRSAIQLATGNAIVSASQDPTGLSIGSKMKGDFDVLSVVATGIDQTQSMLYIAEKGIQSIYDTATQLTQILAKAKLGFMNNDLIRTTLAPTYIELRDEIDRIADAIQFNGQQILNGTNVQRTPAIQSTVAATPKFEFKNVDGILKDPTFSGIEANVDGLVYNGASGNGGFNLGSVAEATILQGDYKMSGTGNGIVIENATIVYKNVAWNTSAGTNSPATSGTTDMKISGLKITLQNTLLPTSSVAGELVISGTNAADIVIDKQGTNAPTVTFSNNQNRLSNGAFTTFTPANLDVNNTGSVELTGLRTNYPMTGGAVATSDFDFVTGVDLNGSIMTVKFPNMRLSPRGSSSGMIESLNVPDNISSTLPGNLTNLQTEDDADMDIPLVKALVDEIVIQLDKVGAYQKRFLNMQAQLANDLEQQDAAQGAILNTDLAKTTEDFTRSSVKVNVTIGMLRQMIDMINVMQKLVA